MICVPLSSSHIHSHGLLHSERPLRSTYSCWRSFPCCAVTLESPQSGGKTPLCAAKQRTGALSPLVKSTFLSRSWSGPFPAGPQWRLDETPGHMMWLYCCCLQHAFFISVGQQDQALIWTASPSTLHFAKVLAPSRLGSMKCRAWTRQEEGVLLGYMPRSALGPHSRNSVFSRWRNGGISSIHSIPPVLGNSRPVTGSVLSQRCWERARGCCPGQGCAVEVWSPSHVCCPDEFLLPALLAVLLDGSSLRFVSLPWLFMVVKSCVL